MINKKFMSKAISIAIVGIMISTPILNTASAMEINRNQKEMSLKDIEEIFDIDEIIQFAKNNGAKKNEIEALLELKNMSFNNTSESKERGIAATTIKVAAKWMKKNSSKIANVLKKYLKINISSKSITTAIDVILDISGTIDELTYNFVDYICDTFRIRCPERNKKIIARALRLIMPI